MILAHARFHPNLFSGAMGAAQTLIPRKRLMRCWVLWAISH